jgi:predicted AlkP superfamily phosphohydrolase/phosphomutase
MIARTLKPILVVLLLAAVWPAGCGSKKHAEEAIAPNPKATAPLGRVIVVGLDGLEPTTVLKLVGEHKLPNFARLIRDGVFGGLMSTLPPSSATAWTSMATGVNPGKHGIYGFMGSTKTNPSGGPIFNTSKQRGFDAVWQVIGRYGLKSIIINIPLTSPADSLNGMMIAGFPHTSDDTASYYWPKSLASELTDYSFDAFRVTCAKSHEDRFIQKMKAIESRRCAVGLRLFEKYPWDLFWLTFVFTDRYQHYLWKYADPHHPMYDAIGAKEYGNAIEDCYEQADGYLGEFMKRMKPDDLLLVVSDHGFRRLYYTVNGQNFICRTFGNTHEVACSDFFGAKFKLEVSGANAEERYASMRTRLIDALRALTDPTSHASIIDSIYVKEDIYKGPYLGSAPDVICMENPDYLFFKLPQTPDLRTIDAGPRPDMAFSGFHQRRGSLGLLGSRVVKGATVEAKVEDVAAIIMAYLGVPAPREIDGHVPDGIFTSQPSGEIRLVKSNITGFHGQAALSNLGSKEMERQLRSVGYMQ